MELGHEILHQVTAVIAIGLFITSLVTWQKQKNKKFLFICLAFFLFALKEGALALGPAPHMFVHGSNLLILIFFALGVFT